LDQIEGFGYLAEHRVFGVLFARYTGIGECFDNESNKFIFLWIMEESETVSVIRSESARFFLGFFWV
jgi:hypothetical protein